MQVDELNRELIPDHGVAELLSISRSMVHKLRAQGKLPEPVRLGRCLRWSRNEIADWINAGCPSRDRWLVLKEERSRA